MEKLGLNEIRERYLNFFEGKQHLRMKSFSLVPQSEKSLLLINAGMAPLKPYFSGKEVPPSKRVTTCQKCIRTLDIERVGKTARHGTFFEMLGNFSFGDYFKHEATAWAWEFITKVLEIPEDRLWVSVYEEDDEARDIWVNEVGVSPDRIVKMGKEDNFWEIGSGPCGPCSELYFDRGEEYGCGKPDCAVGCDCDRYVEFWNLVFTQFDNDGKGNYSRLPHPNIDTGMGLERIACIMQGVTSLFEVDTIRAITDRVCEIAGVQRGESRQTDISLRVITDHIRSTVFLVSDGVLPSNEGRGYVLRRLLRRAARHGRLLNVCRPFLSELCDVVIEASGEAYPELKEKASYIRKVIANEEDKFLKNIDTGMGILNGMIEKIPAGGTLSGEDAFRLYDTYGYPLDLTKEILQEKGMDVDEAGFAEMMDQQRKRAREARAALGDFGWDGEAETELSQIEETVFLGYEQASCEATVQAILRGRELSGVATEGDEASLVLDQTVCYPEKGGQVGDKGVICGEGFEFAVEDCRQTADHKILHNGRVIRGEIKNGDSVRVAYEEDFRAAVRRNHSATHLLQGALRRVLGDHVEQAGSYVDDKRLRFDFTHFSAVTEEELAKAEAIVNEQILADLPVVCREMPIEEAKKLGAMALFGEKYGDVVRVVSMGDVSVEFCGGTHLTSTAQAGLLKIVSESSVAAGVRRIEAVTGLNVLAYLNERQQMLENCAAAVKAPHVNDVVRRSEQLMNTLKEAEHEIELLNGKLAAGELDRVLNAAVEVAGLRLACVQFTGMQADTFRQLGDKLKDGGEDLVALLANTDGEKISFVAVCGRKAVAAGVKAGELAGKAARMTGGGGGGRPDYANAGGKQPEKLAEAMAAIPELVKEMIK
ncbi:MAG: alanine--tRNA ligase [Clostridia bacterium]|nr:alanine--tRNA ligase [Clostridia bacterium]